MSLTPLNKQATRRAFERAAGSYDKHAVLQREVATRLLERVGFFDHQPAIVLNLGSGTATANQALALHFQKSRIIELDWANAFLKVSSEGNPRSGWPVCADMHAIPLATRSVDLVFSNLALSWSNNLSAVYGELRRVMKPGALLAFSCYGPDTLQELKHAWRCVDQLQHVNDFPDMHDIGDELQASGFAEPVMDAEILTLEYPDMRSLLNELKATGSVNVASNRPKGLTGQQSMQKMQAAYLEFRRNSRIPASVEVIYGATFAPEEGQPMRTAEGEVATFSIDALRSTSKLKG
jgi:malonyl-CoA O-methyltransferase